MVQTTYRRWYVHPLRRRARLPILRLMDTAIDYMILATPIVPLVGGSAFGYGGWRPASAVWLTAILGVPALFLAWGIIPGTGCTDCIDFALFFPYAWLFVLMISGGWLVVIVAALVGWGAGHAARASGWFEYPDRV